MGRKAPKLSSILIAVAFALSVFGFTLFVWNSFGGPTPFAAKGYRFHVLFGSEASQLSPNADVRISGVNVGKVIEVRRRGLRADALLELDRRFAPLPSDARAILRYKTLLGETFVQLTPGSPDARKLEEGGTLDPANVADVEQVDVVLGTFDERTRRAMQRFLRGAARALEGRGDDVNAALGHLGTTAESAQLVVDVLDGDRAALAGLLGDSAAALRAIGRRDADLRSLVLAGREVFAATAARDRELTATIRALPPFLSDLRAALTEVETTAEEAAPTLAALDPAVPLVRPALDEVVRLAPELRAVFDEVHPVIDAADTGLPALTGILDAAEPALPLLWDLGRQLLPVSDLLQLYKQEAPAALMKVAAATNYEIENADGTARRVLRVLVPTMNEAFVAQDRRFGSNRYNPYPKPKAVLQLADELEAFDCDHVDNPTPIPVIGTGAPPCVVQGPWEFRGLARAFPHVEADTD